MKSRKIKSFVKGVRAQDIATHLKIDEISLSIDNFGAGFSSLVRRNRSLLLVDSSGITGAGQSVVLPPKNWIASSPELLAMTWRGRVAIARDLCADLSTSLRALAKQSRATMETDCFVVPPRGAPIPERGLCGAAWLG